MKLLRICLLITVVAVTLAIVVPAIAEEERDIGPAAADGTYITFGSDLPSSIFVAYTATTTVDLEIGLRDCCIRDDVVEVYINGSYVWTVDSRNGASGSHPWQYKTVCLPPGNYTIEFRNVISSVGPSGWYYKLTAQPIDLCLIRERLETLEAENAELEGRVAALEAAVAALQAKDVAVQAEIAVLQAKDVAVQAEIAALQTTDNCTEELLEWLIDYVIPSGLINQAEQKGHPMPACP